MPAPRPLPPDLQRIADLLARYRSEADEPAILAVVTDYADRARRVRRALRRLVEEAAS